MGNHPQDPMSAVFSSAMREWRRSAARGLTARGNEMRASPRQRIEQGTALTIPREMETPEKRMTFVASVGSTAPVDGLSGTVGGTMQRLRPLDASPTTPPPGAAPPPPPAPPP